MKKNVEYQLLDFLKSNPGWCSSGELQRRIWINKSGTPSTPRSIVRRLEENAEGENAVLDVEYRNGHSWYRVKEAYIKKKQIVTPLPDGSVRVEYVPVKTTVSEV